MGCVDQLPINLPAPWGLGKVKWEFLCGAMWAMPVSRGLCHAMVISITVFVCSVGFPAKGLLPLDFPGICCVPCPGSSPCVCSLQVSPLSPQQQAGGRGMSNFGLNCTSQTPDLQ